MSDAAGTPPSLGGNPGEPVPEVDPDDLKTFWQQICDLQATYPGRHVAIGLDLMKTMLKPGANADAVFYRTSMIWALNQFAQAQLAPGSRMSRSRMLSSERWRPFPWNGLGIPSEKACHSMWKTSSADCEKRSRESDKAGMISAVLSNRPLIAISFPGSEWHSQDIHPQHPPNEEYRDDGSRDVYYPIPSCFGFAKIEHMRMVAGQRYCREVPVELKPRSPGDLLPAFRVGSIYSAAQV